MLNRVIAQVSNGLFAQAERSFWLPKRGSTTAGEVDWLFYLILGISIFFFLLTMSLMALFLIRYRSKAGSRAAGGKNTSLPLELTWTLIPILVVIVIFDFGFTGFMDVMNPPEAALEILVTGQKWAWFFTYPNGHVDEVLHVPVDQPVRLVMTSQDVIHSFYIPEFRLKRDVLPDRYTKTWFEATEPGEYKVYCAEYCGTGHSEMTANVVVHPPGEYENWLDAASNLLDTMPPAAAGRLLFSKRGCDQCHSVDGSAGTGPTLLGVYEEEQPLADGSTVVADENYLRESILEPMAKIAAGYQPYMPTYKGRLNDQELTALIEYIKTLERE